MANLKRLIVKRFGGTSNFFIFIISSIVIYLLLKSFYFQNEASVSTTESLFIKKSSNFDNDSNKSKQQSKFDPQCQIEEDCSAGQISYKVISGTGYKSFPSICLNGKLVLDESLKEIKIGRGLNLILVDGKTLKIKSTHIFDTFVDDAALLRFLKVDTVDGDIVLMASYDEAANGLRDSVRMFLTNFGSKLISNLKFRDSFVMIGQRGIPKGKAIESLEAKKANKEFAAAAKLSGCAKFPLAVISPVKIVEPHVNSKDEIAVSNLVENCGLRETCPFDEFSVHVYTGKDVNDEPKICVDGKYVIAKGINDAGRGLNIVLVGNGRQVIKTAHFDTYAEDSTNLEIFLEGVEDNVVLIAVTFDEASQKLGSLAKSILFDLGSGLVQNLRHRDAWFFVGRKGIQGFSPLEEISFSGPDNGYPVPLDKRFCVPQTLKGLKIRPDPLPILNDKRRNFCSRYDGYGDFCISENVDKPLNPAPIINRTLEEHQIFSVPIVIIAAMSHNSLRMTLETVIMQPGIHTKSVYVCFDERLEEFASLVDLFGFQSVKLETSQSYMDIYHKALKKMWNLIDKEKKALIVIEEELILSPDFLYFFSQLYDTFMNDPTLAALSSWNPNSFLQVAGSAASVYRTNEFPGLGYMLKRDIWTKYMEDKLSQCCGQRAWHNWKLDESPTKLDVLIPDVSRVFRRPYDISSEDYPVLKDLFNRKRKTNLIPFPELSHLKSLETRSSYVKHLKQVLETSVDFTDAIACYNNEAVKMPTEKMINFKIVFKQVDENDFSELKKLCKCFNLFFHDTETPKSLYMNSVLRFSSHQNEYILIGSKSEILL